MNFFLNKVKYCTQTIKMALPLTSIIHSTEAPTPIGPYSQGVRSGNLCFLSGQIGIDYKTSNLVPGGVAAETDQALKNIGRVLQAAGLEYKDVVKTTILLANISDYDTVNQIYSQYFSVRPPARSAYAVVALPKNARVEIEVIAMQSDPTKPNL